MHIDKKRAFGFSPRALFISLSKISCFVFELLFAFFEFVLDFRIVPKEREIIHHIGIDFVVLIDFRKHLQEYSFSIFVLLVRVFQRFSQEQIPVGIVTKIVELSFAVTHRTCICVA